MNESVPLGTFGDSTCSYGMGSYKPPRGYGDDSPPDRSHNERGGLFMSDDDVSKMRERMSAVEVQITYLRRDFDYMRTAMQSVVASVGKLTDLVSAARGAKWAFVALVAGMGAFSTYLPTIIRFLLAAAK